MKLRLLLVLLVSLTGCVSLHPNRDVSQVSAPELTADQREKDLRALFTRLKEMDPMVHGYAQDLGLPDILAEENSWAKEARECRDNKEFAILIGKVVMWGSQTGHCLLPDLFLINSTQEVDAHMGLSAKDYSRKLYWRDLVDKGYRLAHAQQAVGEDSKGFYFKEAFEANLWTGEKPGSEKVQIPQGSKILKIEGRPVQEWINKASLGAKLQWDPEKKKLRPLSNMDPFLLDPGKGIRGWKTTVQLGNSSQEVTILVPKVQGVTQSFQLPKGAKNLNFRILDEKTAYISILSFLPNDLDGSIREIQDFLKDPQTPTDHLIIDIRYNFGGSPLIWLEGLVRPLIPKTLQYKMKYLVTDNVEATGKFLNKMYEKDPSQKNTMAQGPMISNVKIGKKEDLNLWESTFELSPLNLSLKPRKISLLVNEYCFSASEHLAQFSKATGFAKVFGQRTGGGGTASAMTPPLPFSLPESGMMIIIESSLTYNADGTINQIERTQPDVFLPPVPIFSDLEVSTILAEPWIEAVMESK